MIKSRVSNLIFQLQLWCVYHNCQTTPLSIFIDATNGNLGALRRHLFPSQTTKEIACGMLQMEFAKLCGENVKMFPQKRALILSLMIRQLTELLEIHSKSPKHRDEVWKLISQMTSSKDMDTALKMLKNWQHQLKIEEDILNKDSNRNKQLDSTFEDLVVEIERHNQFQIDRKSTSVASFATYVKSFKKYISNQEKSNRKKGRFK